MLLAPRRGREALSAPCMAIWGQVLEAIVGFGAGRGRYPAAVSRGAVRGAAGRDPRRVCFCGSAPGWPMLGLSRVPCGGRSVVARSQTDPRTFIARRFRAGRTEAPATADHVVAVRFSEPIPVDACPERTASETCSTGRDATLCAQRIMQTTESLGARRGNRRADLKGRASASANTLNHIHCTASLGSGCEAGGRDLRRDP